MKTVPFETKNKEPLQPFILRLLIEISAETTLNIAPMDEQFSKVMFY